MNLQYDYEKAYLHISGLPCEWQLFLKPKPYAHSRMPGRNWKCDNPDFRILSTPTGKPDLSMELFRSDIPENYITIIEPFPSHQWMLLRLLYEGAACLELSLANPVLAYCIANNAEFRTRQEDRISVLAKLCLKKQKELLEWLGFSSTPATVRLFQKILPEAANPSILRMLRAVLKTGEFTKALGHLRQINAGVLALITNRNIAEFVTPGLLDDVSLRNDEISTSITANMLFETCAMLEFIAAMEEIKFPVFNSIRSLQNTHDKLIPQYNEARTNRAETIKCRIRERPFGPPPVPGNDYIVPITKGIDLTDEGTEMHHCVGTYELDIRDGRMYAYKISSPERATLALRKDYTDHWQLWQIQGKKNKRVSGETEQIVKQWLLQSTRQLTSDGERV